jgi:VanZ family protein
MPPIQPLTGRSLTVAKGLFILAMVAAFIAAISPLAIKTGPEQGDKFAHILAFYGLTLFAVVANPRANLLLVAILMSIYGALIEFAQGLEIIGRDRDLWDWVADTAAVLAALIPFSLARMRPAR